MSGRPKNYFVELTESETLKLQQLVAARKTPQSLAKRAKAILCCATQPNWSDAQVASELGGSRAWVRKWRKRWFQNRSLQEAPRTGRPRKFLRACESDGDRDRLHSTCVRWMSP